jgi:CTP:molybdopterin cytidylyltransferase MocA
MLPNATSNSEPIDAVVLAGSVNRIALFPGNAPGRKALVEMNGWPLIGYVLDALEDAPSVGRIVVVGAPEVRALASRWPGVDTVPEGTTLVDNAWRGIQAGRTERVLFCNPDQPLLSAAMVERFTQRALACDADVVTSWVRLESLGEYVEGEHKFARFGDGSYAHGNLFLVKRHFPKAAAVHRRLDRLYQARKNVLRFAWALGPALFLRYAFTMLVTRKIPTLDEVLAIVSKHFGVHVEAVVCPDPEIVLDIDEPEDYEAAARHLAARQRPALQRAA